MKNSWICVSDRLPEDEYYKLVYLEDGDYDLAWYSQSKKKWYWNTFDKVERLVTHWQPLEKPE